MSDYKTVQFKVLSDNCSKEDWLDDNTHQRIADKLYEIISANSEEGLTIGLEGEWGSGKSTVVELLQIKLKENKVSKTFVFYIDAWEHEGDHLRRVFLETLIARLQECSQTRKHFRKLKVINEKVTAKRSSRIVKRRTNLSCFGKLLAFSAIFVPVGSVVVSKLFNEVTICRTAPFHKMFCLGLAMLLAPLWVYGLELIRCLICGVISFFKREPFSLNGWSIFDGKARIDTVNETSLSDERSSIEFARYFDEIMEVVQCEIERIVIIVDNLDRIDQKDAARIWSTLQTFVQNKNPVVKKGKQLCKWIIVPYAQEGLSKIWAEDDFKGGGSNGKQGINRPLSFMDKSFRLRLHVPKMVISSWKGFAKKCIEKAAPSLDGVDVDKILNVLAWTRENLTDAPSPRQVKIYVNQVGMACSLHGGRVPLEAICFYVVKKYLNGFSDRRFEDELRDNRISATSLPQYVNCHKLPSEVAAILYGVEEDKAMQILLEPIITDSLRNSNSAELCRMEKIHGEVFYDVLDYILRCSEDNLIPKFVGSIQKTFPRLNLKAYNSALNALRLHEKVALEQMESAVHEDAIAIIKLASASDNKDLVRSLAKAYAFDLPKRFRQGGGATPPLNPKTEYIGAPSELIKRFGDVTSASKETIQIPYKCFKDEGVDFSKFTADELNGLARYMSDKNVADVDVAEQIQEGKPIPAWVANQFFALTSNGMTATQKTIESISRAFAWNNGQRGNGVYGPPHWDVLVATECINKEFRPIDKAKALLISKGYWDFNNFPNNQTIFLLAKYHGEREDRELVPKNLVNNRINQYRQGWNSKNHDVGVAIYRYITYSHEFEWLASEASKPNRALVGSIAEAALDASDQYLFEVEKPLGFLVNLYRLVDEDHKKALVESFISSDERLTRLTSGDGGEFVDSPLVCQKLLTATKGRDVHNVLVQRVKAEMGGLTQEEWGKAIKESNDIALLVAELEHDGVQLDLANSFSDAFRDLVIEMIKKNVERNLPSETLTSLHKAMRDVFHDVFASGLGDALRETKFKIATSGIKEFVLNVPKYGEWIAASDLQIKNLAAELAKVESIDKFDNFITIIQRCGDGLANKAEIKEIIEQPVQTMLKHEDSRVKEVGEKAAAYFGIEAAVENNAEDKVISEESQQGLPPVTQ